MQQDNTLSSLTSVGTSSASDPLPSREQVEGWSPQDVVAFLMEYNDQLKLYLESDDIEKIKSQRIRGSLFLDLTVAELTDRKGLYQLPDGPAKSIVDLTGKIKGKKKGKFT